MLAHNLTERLLLAHIIGCNFNDKREPKEYQNVIFFCKKSRKSENKEPSPGYKWKRRTIHSIYATRGAK